MLEITMAKILIKWKFKLTMVKPNLECKLVTQVKTACKVTFLKTFIFIYSVKSSHEKRYVPNFLN